MGTRPLSYDVVVVGGGAAGLAAAVAAAGGGARTAFVERYGFLGGMATAGMVSTICGLYRTSSAGPAEPLNPRFAETFAQRLTAMPGCGAPVRRGRTHVLPYTPFAFACLADEVAAEAPDLDVYLHAYLVGLDAPARQIKALRISTWERTQELRAHAVVDTTGDAVVAHRAGAATETALVAERQLPSVVFVLQNVDTDALGPGARVALARALVSAEREGGLPKGASNLAVGPSLQSGEVVCKLALGGIVEELPPGRDVLTRAEQEGRKRILALTTLLKTMPAFTRAFVSHAAPQVGVRARARRAAERLSVLARGGSDRRPRHGRCRIGRRVQRLHVSVARARSRRSSGASAPESRLHPVHVRDHRPQQGRGAVSRGDRRTGPRRRCRAASQHGGPHPLGAPARVPLRGDDRGLHPRRGAHPHVPQHASPTLIHAIQRLEPSVLYASPFHFERLGNLDARVPLTRLRLALSTSAPITAAVMDRLESLYSVPVGQAYGLIEAGLPCINTRTDSLPSTSVGRPVPGYEVAVLSDGGQRPVAGGIGEIAVRSDGLFSAYYAPWQLREDVDRDGWFMTGDIGWLDQAGGLHLKGRKKAVIFVAGLKFFPEEVEDCINEFAGVTESRVFGRPHARLGEIPCAEVALAPGCDLNALKAHCARALSPWKVPLEFAVVSEIPRSPGGKILRRSS